MNSLELYIVRQKLNPEQALNALVDAGLISDNCVNAEDVAAQDCYRACVWLQKHPLPQPKP